MKFSKIESSFKILENGVTIYTEKGIQKGLFFRSIFKQTSIDDTCYSDGFGSGQYIEEVLKHPILKIVSKIINPHITIEKLKELDYDSGYTIKWFTSPIYTVREYRLLEAQGKDIKIKSFGFDDENITCGGSCNKEVTTLKIKWIKRRYKSTSSYNYTYQHKIEELLKNL